EERQTAKTRREFQTYDSKVLVNERPSGLCPNPRQLVYLRKNLGCFVFKACPEIFVIRLRVLACAIVKVQVAQILVDHFFAFKQERESRLIRRLKRFPARLEHVYQQSDKEQYAKDSRRHISVSLRA